MFSFWMSLAANVILFSICIAENVILIGISLLFD